MNGLSLQTIKITGDIEQDQQLLLLGIASLVSLITLSMIIILVIVIVRKIRRNRATKREAGVQASTAPRQMAEVQKKSEVDNKLSTEPVTRKTEAKPVITEQKLETAIPVLPLDEKSKEEAKAGPIIEKKEPIIAKQEPVKEEPQKEENPSQPVDKMEEIRRRLEEIRGQKKDGPTIVLPKIEEAPIIENKTQEPEKEEEQLEEEITLVEDSEQVVVPIEESIEEIEETIVSEAIDLEPEIEEKESLPEESPIVSEPLEAQQIEKSDEPQMVEDEGIMKPVSEINLEEEQPIVAAEPIVSAKTEESTPLPNGKFLPMKKLTFAEWVELFR